VTPKGVTARFGLEAVVPSMVLGILARRYVALGEAPRHCVIHRDTKS
jgi:hypothetical protein